MKNKFSFPIIIVWFILVLISFLWNVRLVKSNNYKIVEHEAQTLFRQIELTRLWNSSHGGVYVPITEITKPNEYLKDSLRDLTSTQGVELTMVNPAYMTRQISELNKSRFDIQFHITSLNPLRPQNKADEWEIKALESFEKNIRETLEFFPEENYPHYKYMAPLVTEKSCLKCHGDQGYTIGDIRGGISITMPAQLYLDTQNTQILYLLVAHFLTFILGLTGMLLFFKYQRKYFKTIKNKNIELERKEHELIKTNKHLTDLNIKKDKFFSIIAHDLKNPFNNIVGFSELLADKDEKFSQGKKDSIVDNIYKTAQNTYKLLENLLDWALTELDKIDFNLKSFNLHDVIEENIYLTLMSANRKGVEIINLVAKKNDIKADKKMLNTILRNLFSNAIKFSNPGGRVEVYEDVGTKYHNIIIEDHGIGMTQKQQQNLFKIDIDQSTTGTNDEAGTGLGLILCKEFIDKHKGKIKVESELNKGSRFTISFPL